MAISGFDPTDPRVQLEIMRERLNNSEVTIRQLEGTLAQAYANLGRKETEINQLRDEREDLKLKWELAKRDLKHIQEKSAKSRNTSKGQAILASILFFLSSGLVGFGTSYLTSTSLNSLGWILMAFAVALYIMGTLLTTLFAFEGRN